MLCECGCGEETTYYTRSCQSYRKGEWARFKVGHSTRGTKRAAKLTPDRVRAIRKKRATTRMTTRQIAKFYGVGQTCIEDVLSGRTWKDVV